MFINTTSSKNNKVPMMQVMTSSLDEQRLQVPADNRRTPSRDLRSLRAGAIHDLNSSKMRSISSAAYNRGIHSNSRQTDQMRSEIGGRASAQDSASTYMRTMLMELKKPQPSDIIPVFRLTKARKKSNVEVISQQASNGSSPKMHKVQLMNDQLKQ